MPNTQVLVVEDERLIAKALQHELRSMGYEVPAVASSGEEAIRKAEETRPDLVLMDIVLKGPINGIEAARRVRNRLDIPIVYLTAYGDDETLGRAKETEPFGYLLKPYEEKELHTTIEMALYKHRLEKQLKESNQWLRATLNSIDDAVIATDERQNVRLLNRVAEALTGWIRDDALGKPLSELCPLVQKDKRGVLEEAVQRAVASGRPTVLPDDVSVVSRGVGRVPVEGSVAPLHDDAGALTSLVVVLRDVSARREMEQLERQTEEYLRHAQKMEAVSRLAGGVAHEFNNLLTAILGNSSLVLANLSKIDPNLHLVSQIEIAASRAAEVVKQLLSFSGRTRLSLEVLNVNEIVQEVMETTRRTIDPRVTVEFEPGDSLWLVRGDRSQLRELLMNLSLNAREAMPEGGRLWLETANVNVPEAYVHATWHARPGDYVRLRVKDTGCGIVPELQSRIFEPFFTTKEVGRGTGLGLALVFGIVEEHRGWIECHSRPGEGARFDVYLPRYGQKTSSLAGATAPAVPKTATATILLAEDEPMLRDLGATILQRCGYQVLLAEDGLRAVEIFQKLSDQIDLVILDLNMPKLSGEDALRRMVEIDSEVRVLFSSGFFGETTHFDDSRVLGCVPKPYRHDELVEEVRSALEQCGRRHKRTEPVPDWDAGPASTPPE